MDAGTQRGDAAQALFDALLAERLEETIDHAELRGLDPPVYVIARNPSAPEAFDPVAQGFVKGRRFVLWSKQ